ncbi:MAG TPA: hypothetical protein VK427_27120, partial [Kofleriaceae bacterium]|nr:hypothetical protein [Kofleriaceae bacterium]
VMERELLRSLIARREKLLARFLTRLSPLARPRIDEQGRLCVTDARIEGGLVVAGRYAAKQGNAPLEITLGASSAERCTPPLARGAYTLVELRADKTNPLRVHVYDHGGVLRVAGLDRE